MKKFFILAAGVVALGLGSCGRTTCPAYTRTNGANHATQVTASAEAPAARQ